MSIGYIIGFIGAGLGLLVPIPQLMKIRRGGHINGILLHTYIFLVLALACYLIHAIYIDSIVFTIAQSINLATNSVILAILWRRR